MEYYSAVKKNKEKPCAVTWKDLEVIILREVKPDKERYISHCSHVESKKNGTNKLIYKTEVDSQT